MSTVVIIFIILAGLTIYFIPTITAYAQEKRNKGPVFVINLFLGWTFIGWIAALIMAVSKDKHIVIHTVNEDIPHQKTSEPSVKNKKASWLDDWA